MNAIRLRSSFHIFIALLIRSLWSLTRGSYYVFTQARLAQLRRNRSVGKIIHLSEDSLHSWHSWHSWHSRLSFLSTPLKTIHYLIQAQYLCSTRTQSSNNATSVVFQIWWNWKANAYSVMEGSEFRCWNVARLAHSMLSPSIWHPWSQPGAAQLDSCWLSSVVVECDRIGLDPT